MTHVHRQPVLDPVASSRLYAFDDRLAQRTNALHRAKVSGRYVPEVIPDLAAACALPDPPRILDVGCGRGSTTLALAERFPRGEIVAVDRSLALLTAARERAARLQGRTRFIQADFHMLPAGSGGYDLAVAAFCLYHSAEPGAVIAEIARCLATRGTAILVTKSVDSYRELDELISASGLDPYALTRPSLYETAHSDNLAELAADGFDVMDVIDEPHRFQFNDLLHVADYLVTTPKYNLGAALQGDAEALAAELRRSTPDLPLETASRVTYVVARRGSHP